ncbi:MAG: ComEC/Rec2 family competence protein [Clostridium sp.]|jgi:competence protein ComEC|nr:ComEC/Rec2 family competence protein [Clostridium sp.]
MVRRPLFLVCLCLIALAGIWQRWKPPEEQAVAAALRTAAGREVLEEDRLTVTGRVYRKESRRSFGREQVILDLRSVSLQEIGAYTGKNESYFSYGLLCETEGEDVPSIGEKIQITGQFSYFSQATNPGGFHEAQYYRSLQLGGRLKKAAVSATDGRRSWIGEGLYQLREGAKARLYRSFPEKEASVLAAMLLGDRQALDAEVAERYRRNGMIHLLSISGLHISMIGLGVYRLLRRLRCPVPAAAVTGGALLLLYGILTGMGVSAQRAVGMFLIRMAGECVGRTYDMVTALGILAVVLLAGQPQYLYHSGFLLSFGSVCGLGLLLPVLEKGRKKEAGREGSGGNGGWLSGCFWEKISRAAGKNLRGLLLAGLSVTLFLLPIQLWYFYEIPLYSVVLNAVILPLAGPLLAAGMAVLLFPGAGVLAWAAQAILAFYDVLCSLFEKLPFHTWRPGQPGAWQVVLYYAMLAALIWRKPPRRAGKDRAFFPPGLYAARKVSGLWKKRGGQEEKGADKGGKEERGGKNGEEGSEKRGEERGKDKSRFAPRYAARRERTGKPRRFRPGKQIWLAAAVLVLGFRFRSGLAIDFLDVGQGDCICIQTETGEVYLFDGGSSSRRQIGKYAILPYLKQQGITYLDAVFISHPDTDHYSGILELLEMGEEHGIAIGKMVLPAIAADSRRQEFEGLLGGEGSGGEGGNAGEGESAGEPAVPVCYMAAGSAWNSKDISFLCLHPPDGYEAADANAYSLCYLVEAGDFSLLLTGDVEGKGEERLLLELAERRIENLTVLKVAHHGSRNSTSQAFLDQLDPAVAVISCGRNNSYGHPHKELLQRLEETGAAVFLTSASGAVRVRVEEGKMELRVFCGQ